MALLVGLVSMKVTAQNIARPVRKLRDAMDRVGEGDIEVEVEVDDASEVGRLQAGFNQMVEGLRERERLRDLFGKRWATTWPPARRSSAAWGSAASSAPWRRCSADIVGSTALAARERPSAWSTC